MPSNEGLYDICRFDTVTTRCWKAVQIKDTLPTKNNCSV